MVKQLPPVDRIQGAILEGDSNLEESSIRIQYTDDQEKWLEVSVPFLDAMYLLNLLKSIHLDSGYQMPDDPRGE